MLCQVHTKNSLFFLALTKYFTKAEHSKNVYKDTVRTVNSSEYFCTKCQEKRRSKKLRCISSESTSSNNKIMSVRKEENQPEPLAKVTGKAASFPTTKIILLHTVTQQQSCTCGQILYIIPNYCHVKILFPCISLPLSLHMLQNRI